MKSTPTSKMSETRSKAMSDEEQEVCEVLEAIQEAVGLCAGRVRVEGLRSKLTRRAVLSDLDEINSHIQDVREQVESHE